jgi:mannitol operon transcriptional antiterminator
MPFQNPLTDEVRKAYPALWKATQSAVHELDQGTAFPAEEIAYITMYMGMALDLTRRLSRKPGRRVVIACPSGGVTVWMLVSRLKMELPELEVVDTISLRHISRVDSDDIDAIISTAKLNARNVPVITVSPLVNDQDIAQIRQTLSLN